MDEFRNTGALEIAATATEYANTIFNVAEKSKNLKGTFIKELKEAAAATTAAIDILARRVQTPQSEAVEEELNRIRKELRELRYENKKMKAVIAQQQKEIREGRSPILRPPLAARERNLTQTKDGSRRTPEREETLTNRELTCTETNTSVGPMSEWERDVEPSEGTAMDLDLDGPSRQRTSRKRRRNEDKNETKTETDNRKRKSPVHATSPASRRCREERDQADDINKKLNWLVDEIMQIKRSIGKQDKEKDKEVQKKRTQPQLREKKSGVTERKRSESNAPPPKNGKALNKDGGTTCSQIIGKGANRNLGRTNGTAVASQRPPPTSKKTSTQQKKRRLPRTSAVVITCPPGQYEENLKGG